MSRLPDSPAGRNGWPWVGEIQPDSTATRSDWPRITVVTPSFNQAEFIEETIRSVLLQGYPKLEYIVIDGGSTDGSVEIIKKYSPWLAYWCSESDRGQSHAINKGFERATGEILGWINSDDIFYPGALHAVADGISDADLFLGGMVKVRREGVDYVEVKRSTPLVGKPIHEYRILSRGPRHEFHFFQPSLFWTRRLWQQAGPLDGSYHFVMDREWCNRALAEGAAIALSDQPIARFTLHEESKSVALEEHFAVELVRMYLHFAVRPGYRFFACLLSCMDPVQGLFGRRSRKARTDGATVRAWVYLNLARAIKLLRRVSRGGGHTEAGRRRPSD